MPIDITIIYNIYQKIPNECKIIFSVKSHKNLWTILISPKNLLGFSWYSFFSTESVYNLLSIYHEKLFLLWSGFANALSGLSKYLRVYAIILWVGWGKVIDKCFCWYCGSMNILTGQERNSGGKISKIRADKSDVGISILRYMVGNLRGEIFLTEIV